MKNLKLFISLILILSAVSAFAISPLGAKAQMTTDAQLQAMIAKLQAQVAVLMQKIAELQVQQGSLPAWCHNFNKNLKIDDVCKGNVDDCEVLQLQNVLEKEGIQGSYKDNANGSGGVAIFGEHTASAVSEFQEKYASEILGPSGLARGTGYAGPATRAKLNALYGCRIACTMDAKQCPDGSYVSRTGPNCEFAKCPTAQCTTDADCPQPTCGSASNAASPTCIGNPIKCVEGKCVSTPKQSSLTCKDTDKGDDIYIKGTITIKDPSGNQKSYADYCQDLNSVQEYSCNVDAAQNQTVDNAYRLGYNACPNGCDNGACKKAAQPSGIILFYGQGCPHCTNVDNYIAANNIAQKVKFTKLEVYNNQDNAKLLADKSESCGLESSGVPFLWDGVNKCIVGDASIISFFSKYISSVTVLYPNGGEALIQGKTYEIKWSTNSKDYNEDIDIKLYDYSKTDSAGSPVTTQIARFYNNSNLTTYKWTIPSDLAGSSYKIRVLGMISGGTGESISDFSDSYFSIVAPSNTGYSSGY